MLFDKFENRIVYKGVLEAILHTHRSGRKQH